MKALSVCVCVCVCAAVTSSSASAVGGLVELGDDTRTLPVSYLAALLVLFAFMVADRTVRG